MHFQDCKRKVDYVLAYHYRKRTSHPGGDSPGLLHRPGSLAIISNGETAKNQPEQQQEQHRRHGQDIPSLDAEVIDLGPLDALEETKRVQRDEFEHNLVEAGLEIEKDVEVRGQGGKSQDFLLFLVAKYCFHVEHAGLRYLGFLAVCCPQSVRRSEPSVASPVLVCRQSQYNVNRFLMYKLRLCRFPLYEMHRSDLFLCWDLQCCSAMWRHLPCFLFGGMDQNPCSHHHHHIFPLTNHNKTKYLEGCPATTTT